MDSTTARKTYMYPNQVKAAIEGRVVPPPVFMYWNRQQKEDEGDGDDPRRPRKPLSSTPHDTQRATPSWEELLEMLWGWLTDVAHDGLIRGFPAPGTTPKFGVKAHKDTKYVWHHCPESKMQCPGFVEQILNSVGAKGSGRSALVRHCFANSSEAMVRLRDILDNIMCIPTMSIEELSKLFRELLLHLLRKRSLDDDEEDYSGELRPNGPWDRDPGGGSGGRRGRARRLPVAHGRDPRAAIRQHGRVHVYRGGR